MTLEQVAIDELRREVRDLSARIKAQEKTLFSFQQAMIRFGARVAHCVKEIEAMGPKK